MITCNKEPWELWSWECSPPGKARPSCRPRVERKGLPLVFLETLGTGADWQTVEHLCD